MHIIGNNSRLCIFNYEKMFRKNNAKSIALIGMFTSHILYIVVSIIFTDVLKNFNIQTLLYIAPLTLCQMIGYICGILFAWLFVLFICANKDGEPNLDDRWVVNGMVFINTYEEV